MTIERIWKHRIVVHSVGGVRTTPAVWVGGEEEENKRDRHWFVQGSSSGSVRVFEFDVETQTQGDLFSLNFDLGLSLPVTDIVWNAGRRQLAVVHGGQKITFFYLCIDSDLGSLQCSELQTYEHHKRLGSVHWLRVDPVVVAIDQSADVVLYNTAQQQVTTLVSPEKQTEIAVGRFLDEIASYGEQNECCVYVWKTDQGKSVFWKLQHPAAVRGFTWCCNEDRVCLLVTATSEGLHVWSKCSIGSTIDYLPQFQVNLDYDISGSRSMLSLLPFEKISRQLAGSNTTFMILCQEESSFVLHRYIIRVSKGSKVPVMAQINSLQLQSNLNGEDLRCLQAFPTLEKRCLLSFCSKDLMLIWEMDNQIITCSNTKAALDVNALACVSTSEGNQTQVDLVRYHSSSGLVFTGDSRACAHIWKVNEEQHFVLVDEFSLDSRVLDAMWAEENPGEKSEEKNRDSLILVLEMCVILVEVPGGTGHESEQWVLDPFFEIGNPRDFEPRDLELLSYVQADSATYHAVFVTKTNSVFSVEVRLSGDTAKCVAKILSSIEKSSDSMTRPLQGCGLPQKVSLSLPSSKSLYFLTCLFENIYLVELAAMQKEKYLIRDCCTNSQIISSTLSHDLCHLFTLMKIKSEYQIIMWKKRHSSKEFNLHSRLITSTHIVAYDILSFPSLTPVALMSTKGKAETYVHNPLSNEWSASCIADMLPHAVSHVKFLNPKRLLIVSNEQLLTVRVAKSKNLERLMTSNKIAHLRERFDGIQVHFMSMYNPFQITSISSVMECILQGKFHILGLSLDIVKQIVKLYSETEYRQGLSVEESKIRDLYQHYFGDQGALDCSAPQAYSPVERTRLLTEIDTGLNTSWNSNYCPASWRYVLDAGTEVHRKFLDMPSPSLRNGRLVLWYLHQSFVSSLISETDLDKEFQTQINEDRFWGFTELDAVWGVLSDDKEALLQCAGSLGMNTWEKMRCTGIGYWINSKELMTAWFEKIAKGEFLRKRDPHDCAIFYLALGKANILAGLCRATGNSKLGDFMKRNFNEESSQVAAMKNAYALLGQHRYQLAAAFFILARKPEDAIEVCVKNLEDTQLGLCIALVLSNDKKNYYKELITEILVPKAKEEVGIHKHLLYCTMLNDRQTAMNVLINLFIDKSQWKDFTNALGKTELIHFVQLVGDIYGMLCEEDPKVDAESQVDFIFSYSEVLCSLGNNRTIVSWCKRLAKAIHEFPSHKESLSKLQADLVGNVVLSYGMSLHLFSLVPLSGLIGKVEDMLSCACACLGADLAIDGKRMFQILEKVLFLSESGKEPREELMQSEDRYFVLHPKVKKSQLDLRPPPKTIHHFQKSLKAIKANACNAGEVTASSSSGLFSAKIDVLCHTKAYQIETEMVCKQNFPTDSWTLPVLAETGTLMPQWAILNISKADVSASLLNVHPSRSLFVSNGVHDIVLLWHFHQQSAMSCYRLPPKKHNTNVQSISFDARGDKLCCIYSTGTTAVFSVNALPTNGTTVDCNISADVFCNGGTGTDVRFLGESGSVVMGTGFDGTEESFGSGGGLRRTNFFVWDTLVGQRSNKIHLQKMSGSTKLYTPTTQPHTFVCADAEGGVGFFDWRRLAPKMVPFWYQNQSLGRTCHMHGFGKTVAVAGEEGICMYDLQKAKVEGPLIQVKNCVGIDCTGEGLVMYNSNGLVQYLEL